MVPVAAPASVVSADPLATVQRIKDATVYIKVMAGRVGGTGTGFVVRRQGETILIATNRHVVSPHRTPQAIRQQDPNAVKPTITVVFRSGQGPALEHTCPAEVVAIDESEEIQHDLAILAVQGVKNPPAPIEPPARVDLVETMKYTAYGFPFGDFSKSLGTAGNPSITVTSGTVSALRKDEHGHLVAIQLDGSLQPGNSGGPLVDEKGRLLGVAVAKLAAADTIGLAIPAPELALVLDGRVGALNLVLGPGPANAAELQVTAQVVDPLNKIKEVQVGIVPASGRAPVSSEPRRLLVGPARHHARPAEDRPRRGVRERPRRPQRPGPRSPQSPRPDRLSQRRGQARLQQPAHGPSARSSRTDSLRKQAPGLEDRPGASQRGQARRAGGPGQGMQARQE